MNPALLQREMSKYERYSRLSDMTQEDLDRDDQQLWEAWLTRYTQRLKADDAAGEGDVKTTRVQRQKVCGALLKSPGVLKACTLSDVCLMELSLAPALVTEMLVP